MSDKGYIAVIGSGPREYREAIYRSLQPAGLWQVDSQEPTWQKPYIAGHSVLPRLNSAQVSANLDFVVDALRDLAAARPVTGILTFEEMFLPAACRAATDLGLPNIGVEAAENCRDKGRTRRILTAAGLRQPGFAFATSVAEAAEIAGQWGYPVVLKPRGLAGSIGVIMASDAGELRDAFAAASDAARQGAQRHGGGVLVEEFLDGPEVSVDCAVLHGVVAPLFLARKRFGPPPFFEETGQTVATDDPLLSDPDLMNVLRRSHEALGIDTGMTHTEIKLTSAGPAVVEVNGRMAGDYVTHLAYRAGGLDVAAVAGQVARGERPDGAFRRSGAAAVQVVYADQDGTFRSLSLPREGQHAHVVEAGRLLEAGTPVALPPRGYMSRCGYVITAAPTVDECHAALDAALSEMALDITPV